MTVKELITRLVEMPEDAELICFIKTIPDGESNINIKIKWVPGINNLKSMIEISTEGAEQYLGLIITYAG